MGEGILLVASQKVDDDRPQLIPQLFQARIVHGLPSDSFAGIGGRAPHELSERVYFGGAKGQRFEKIVTDDLGIAREQNEVLQVALLSAQFLDAVRQSIRQTPLPVENRGHVLELEPVGAQHYDLLEPIDVLGAVELAVVGHTLPRALRAQKALFVVMLERPCRHARQLRHLARRHGPLAVLAYQIVARLHLRFARHALRPSSLPPDFRRTA